MICRIKIHPCAFLILLLVYWLKVFGIKLAKIYAFRLLEDGFSRTFFKEASLTDENGDGIYNCTITGFEHFDYVIRLMTTDGIRNEYTNESILTVNMAGTNFETICSIFVIIGLPIILVKYPRRNEIR